MNTKHIFLILTIVAGIFFGWPHHDYMDLLSQGDHGRDLYAADQAFQGQLPYKDYWWVYGPIMPYYYGLFFKVLGAKVSSMLLGQMVLSVACGVAFYFAALMLMPPAWAFLSAVWFIQVRQEFFFTFNHIGGILCGIFILYCLFHYLKNLDRKILTPALVAAFVFMMVKINFGLAGLVGLACGVWLIDYVKKVPFDHSKKTFYLTALATLGISLLIYWLLLKDLPLYAIRQCMPYYGDDQPYHVPPLLAVIYYLQQHWLTLIHGPINMALGVILHGSTAYTIYLLVSGKIESDQRRDLLLALTLVGMFFVLYFHEFIVSGVWYRTYWSLPYLMMFHFIMVSTALRHVHKALCIAVLIVLGGLIALGGVAEWGMISQQRIPPRYLSVPRGEVYLGNEPQWTDTVNTVTKYLNSNLKEGETFFALPYDCIYYYLTGKRSPTRQLIFFDHIKIPLEQEVSIIKELEAHNVQYVLMSSRIASPETGLGVFGATYCPLISKYVKENYQPIFRQGGDWNQPPGWANNHGVLLLKKK